MSEVVSRITLVRHGRPTVSLMEWVPGRSLTSFIDRYNAASIAADSLPGAETQAAIADATLVLTSDYIRTQDSAAKLQLQVDQSEPQYREVDCWVDFPSMWAMPAWFWVIVTRILWPNNQISAPETFADAENRAKICAQDLSNKAQGQQLVLVGHGGMNTLIARELVAMGWEGPKQPKLTHWGATSYLKSSL